MATTDSKLKKKNLSISSSEDEEKEEDSKKETEDIDLGISLEKLNLGPKKKLLVLPIGGFLVHRAHRRRPNTIPKNRTPDFSHWNFLIYKRPFCKEFLKFCFERYQVGIWSSAMEHNIDGVLTNIMGGDLKNKLLFIWDQRHCTDTGFMSLENKKKPLFMKQLKYLWQKKYSSLPWRDGAYSMSNTLLVTDHIKALLNPPNTAISPGEYDPKNKEDDFLGSDGGLRLFLDGLAEAKDVPSYVKDHPFGEPAITTSHPDWEYYSKIIRRFDKKEVDDLKKD